MLLTYPIFTVGLNTTTESDRTGYSITTFRFTTDIGVQAVVEAGGGDGTHKHLWRDWKLL